MSKIEKTIRIGTQPQLGSLFCRIKFADGKLSITGVEGPKRNGDALGACGQIDMHQWNVTDYAPGWNAAMVSRFREIWHAWHLNDMFAGSPAQRAYLDANPITDRLDHYGKARDALRAAGLSPDPSYVHNGKPYTYGSAWLREEVPADVIEFLESLPETDQTPAWV
jgi:hypothetical protein